MDDIEEFFVWYKRAREKKEEIAILEDYINNSDDFKMDCSPLPLPKNDTNK